MHASLTNAPVPPTVLIGREAEMGALRGQLALHRTRLLTLVGPPGVGKTRLSLEAAAEAISDFDEGVFFVALAPIVDPGLVTAAIARTVGIREESNEPVQDVLKRHLRDKRMLLVLDNFEHVVMAGPQVADLLATCPWLIVLVTSRERLHVRGERVFSVQPLNVPDLTRLHPFEELLHYSALELFAERARDVDTDFELVEENAQAVAAICAHLDGLPLAIELAAPHINVLSPQEMLRRLDELLKAPGLHDLPARHQTRHSAIEWSYSLLGEAERRLFRRLAVFSGGHTLEAAQAVCNTNGDLGIDVLVGTESLVSKSLLQTRQGRDGSSRMRMLETIHEYAREKLEESGEADELRQHHATYFLSLAEAGNMELTGPNQSLWLGRFEDEHENLRAVLRWVSILGEGKAGIGAAPELGVRLGGALWRFWYLHNYLSEGRSWLSAMLALMEKASVSNVVNLVEPSPELAHLLYAAGVLASQQGDLPAARIFAERSLCMYRALDDQQGSALPLNLLGNILSDQGDYAASRALQLESLTILRETSKKHRIATALNSLGVLDMDQGKYDSARAFLEESLAMHRDLEDDQFIAAILNNLGLVAGAQGDYEAGATLLEEACAIFRQLEDKQSTANTVINLAVITAERGNIHKARSLCIESLVMANELRNKVLVAECLETLAWVLVLPFWASEDVGGSLRQDAERAVQFWTVGATLRESQDASLPERQNARRTNGISAASFILSESAFAASEARARGMSEREVIALAIGTGTAPEEGVAKRAGRVVAYRM
jgi:predicted ATPase